jgi:hypothetical protein
MNVAKRFSHGIFMKGKLKQWWSTIPSISTNRTNIYFPHSHNTNKTTTYNVGNAGPLLKQAHTHVYKQTIKKPAQIRFHSKRQHTITN